MKIMARHKFLVFILGTIFLGSCIPFSSAEFTFEIQPQEKWIVTIVLTAPAQYAEDVAKELADITNNTELKAMNVLVSVKTLAALPNGDIPHEVILKGQGYDTLNQVWGNEVISVGENSGQRKLLFNMNPYTDVYAQMTPETTIVILKGGNIITSNGINTNNTVTWTNPADYMYAEMSEPILTDYLPYIIIGGGALIIVIGIILIIVLLLLSRKKKHYQAKANFSRQKPNNQPYPQATQFQASKKCYQCNTQIPSHATFCPMCGAKQE